MLRLEQKANDTFRTYVHLYYDYALSSVYFINTKEPGFNACFLVKKDIEGTKTKSAGQWDAIHIAMCNMSEMPKVTYQVISTVMISLDVKSNVIGKMELTGSSSKSSKE